MHNLICFKRIINIDIVYLKTKIFIYTNAKYNQVRFKYLYKYILNYIKCKSILVDIKTDTVIRFMGGK